MGKLILLIFPITLHAAKEEGGSHWDDSRRLVQTLFKKQCEEHCKQNQKVSFFAKQHRFQVVETAMKIMETFLCSISSISYFFGCFWLLYNDSITLRESGTNVWFRSPYRVPGYWPPSAHRDEPNTQALPHAHLCTKHSRRKVTILVFLDETAESEEVKRRNCQPQCGT